MIMPRNNTAESDPCPCRYAWECQTQEGGWGLDNVLREQSWKLRGIVNGIDYSEWSPQVWCTSTACSPASCDTTAWDCAWLWQLSHSQSVARSLGYTDPE